jgi:integrating conjugative element protein (TIGR03765 family)
MARLPAITLLGLWLIGLALTPPPAWAELTVIYDSGDTRPLAPLLDVFDATAPVTKRAPTKPPALGAADLRALLPIRSPGLSPGPVQARAQPHPFARPFFLIGADARSRRWLAAHRDRLKAIGAVGMLVQADTLADLQAIAALADGLPITPASAADIAAALGVAHYPVLVTSRGIEQ